MQQYLYLVPVIPLVCAIIMFFFGKYFPKKGVFIGITGIFISFLISLKTLIVLIVTTSGTVTQELSLKWFAVGHYQFELGIIVDGLSVIMITMVTFISFLIQIYSMGYMEDDLRYMRFFSYLSLFTASMLGLVLSNNFIQLFICWELVGLCSYLLIGFWFEKKSAALAGNKAFITTKIGDFGFYIGIFLLFATFGTFNILQIQQMSQHHTMSNLLMTAIPLFLFCGAVGKSAQFPLHVWLPDAMEGPTPVSALIHAATMVAAGVYMVVRCYFLFSLSATALNVVCVIGIITAFLAGTMALVTIDLKRVLAFSTISQLGYMMLALGVGNPVAGMFHLITHAFFKALLFLCAGSVIHAVHTNDMNDMGSLHGKMKITSITFLIGSLSISGIWPFAGFFSKDEILISIYNSGNMGLYIVATLVAFLTAFYMFRAYFLTFTGVPRNMEKYKHCHESPFNMSFALIVLSVFAVILGKILTVNNIFGRLLNYAGDNNEQNKSLLVPVISSIVAFLGIGLAYIMYYSKILKVEKFAKELKGIHKLLINKYYFDEMYQLALIKPMFSLTKILSTFDLKVIDGAVNGFATGTRLISKIKNTFDIYVIDFLVNSVANAVNLFGKLLRKLQTGLVQNYLLFITLGLGILLLIQLF
ncbi:MAG: NADH-quinone oxidoreductase subunit L [Elusimicrobia bacterium]|nr:NADH-quinone oxidoreductase subunit L [Elusimicrobiota bacterium]